MKKTLILMLVLLASMFVFVGCEEIPALPGGQTPAPAPAGLSNLEIVEKITAEWEKTDKVFATFSVAQRANPGGCAHCHDGATFAAGKSGSIVGPHMTGIDCAACHTGLGAELIDNGVAKANLPHFNGSFVKADVNAEAALCITCHSGRRDAAQTFLNKRDKLATSFSYPHYGAYALTSGQGGMEYPDATYAKSPVHTNMSCIACHMPKTSENYVSHTFKPEVGASCGTCHVGATSFDVNGYKTEVKKMLEKTYEAVLAATGTVEIGTASGQFYFQRADGSRLNVANDVTTEQFVAAWNWYLIKGDKSYGVHNPVYTKSLLKESYKRLTGNDL